MEEYDSNLDDAYSELEDRVKSVPIEASKEVLETFKELIGESNELVKKAKATVEVIKDAYVVSALTSSIHESTKCINVSESNFEPQIFANAVMNFINRTDNEQEQNEPNWSVLAQKCSAIYRYAPGLTYITAYKSDQPSSQTAKVVERKARQAKKPLEERKEPEKVKTITKNDEGALERIYKILARCYKHNGKNPVCLFQFVIDNTSFSKTIENIFHLSFLARDGHVQISLDNRRLPILTPLAPEKTNNNPSDRAKVQALLSITQPQWREIVSEFNITEAMIP